MKNGLSEATGLKETYTGEREMRRQLTFLKGQVLELCIIGSFSEVYKVGWRLLNYVLGP